MELQTKNSHKRENYKTDFHGTSYAKHLKSKKHLNKMKQEDMIIPDWLLQEFNKNSKNIPRRMKTPKTLKQTARKKELNR